MLVLFVWLLKDKHAKQKESNSLQRFPSSPLKLKFMAALYICNAGTILGNYINNIYCIVVCIPVYFCWFPSAFKKFPSSFSWLFPGLKGFLLFESDDIKIDKIRQIPARLSSYPDKCPII